MSSSSSTTTTTTLFFSGCNLGHQFFGKNQESEKRNGLYEKGCYSAPAPSISSSYTPTFAFGAAATMNFLNNNNMGLAASSRDGVSKSNENDAARRALPDMTPVRLEDLGVDISFSRRRRNELDESVYVKKVSCGKDFIYILLSDNRVISRGGNRYGQLGLGHRQEICDSVNDFLPVTVSHNETIEDIQCGADFAYFLTKSSNIYSVGNGSYGKLATGNFNNVLIPTRVKSSLFNFRIIEHVACGHNHVVFINEDGEVYGCGANFSGQLGLTHSKDMYIPENCEFFSKKNNRVAVAGSCGECHTAVLTSAGEIYVSGDSKRTHTNYFTFFASDAIGVFCGRFHTIIQITERMLRVSGNNKYKQLSIPHKSTEESFAKVMIGEQKDKITNISTSEYHTIFILNDCEVHSCGTNRSYVLGTNIFSNDTTCDRVVPIKSFPPKKGYSLKCSSNVESNVFYWTKEFSNIQKHFVFSFDRLISFADITIS
ncbi:hypothetical protein NAEGRDRAFT_80487 [Naegleria gruberi]|uniref:Uncharacterized protein n=1 Tax=Naegleria gruberi TaxID=5762 RepID=D2VLY7_NAEGR|nr:uncharacterized protein NAEGRDRAFT_80487 [Naegleria gruberi]EFC42136.1 hypothetical protein NAEGRDRAFT_80487 [Naegleria gruberi]|eukprot:XP_002674880.1 hypothetical protein NAEGRDRAFT_80487 [Naegleria gruberi strain NEG-M]